MKNEKLIEFLTELTKLTDKYGFGIGGCGCCGSPWVTSDGVDGGKNLEYDEEKGCYRVDIYDGYDYHDPIYVYGDKEDYDNTLCECWLFDYDNRHHYCNKTKERDMCHCGGDVKKCDFYPKKRGEQNENN